jgi:ankyrin repeat protein
MAVLLLKYDSALVNTPNRLGWTPLHDACFGKRFGVFIQLIDRGANVNAKTTVYIYCFFQVLLGQCLVHVFVYLHMCVLRFVLSRCNFFHIPLTLPSPTLFLSSLSLSPTIQTQLLYVHVKDGMTPLHCAAFVGQISMTKILVDKQAELSPKNEVCVCVCYGKYCRRCVVVV